MFFKQNTNSRPTGTGLRTTGNRKSAPSVISSDLNILGNMISDGLLDINGRIEGNVKAEEVTIRVNGVITGDVVAETIHVFGKVVGLVKAKQVHLYASSHVEGVIMHESIAIEDGAFIDGKFKRSNKVMLDNTPRLSQQFEDMDQDEEPSENVLDGLKLITEFNGNDNSKDAA